MGAELLKELTWGSPASSAHGEAEPGDEDGPLPAALGQGDGGSAGGRKQEESRKEKKVRCLLKLCLDVCAFPKLVQEWAPGYGCPWQVRGGGHRPGTEALGATPAAGGLRGLSVLAPQRKATAPALPRKQQQTRLLEACLLKPTLNSSSCLTVFFFPSCLCFVFIQ